MENLDPKPSDSVKFATVISWDLKPLACFQPTFLSRAKMFSFALAD